MQNRTKADLNGFTLIEILVVIVIVGITLSFTLLAFGDFGSERRIRLAADQFVNYVKFVQQQAIYKTGTFAIVFNKNTYQILEFQPPVTWKVTPNKSIFHVQHFPTDTLLSVTSNSMVNGNPSIIINAAGDMTPFQLNIRSQKNKTIASIVGKTNGEVAVQPLPST